MADPANRTTGTAAVAGTTVPTTMTATVTAIRATAGPTALTDRQNVPSITGRSTR